MIEKLAEEMYEKSIQIKKFDYRSLIFKSNRMALLKELQKLEELNNSIIELLHESNVYSAKYYDLSSLMGKTLTECISYLTSKGKNYRMTVQLYVWAFHNLPRAFLPENNPAKATPDEAIEYFKPYLKLD